MSPLLLHKCVKLKIWKLKKQEYFFSLKIDPNYAYHTKHTPPKNVIRSLSDFNIYTWKKKKSYVVFYLGSSQKTKIADGFPKSWGTHFQEQQRLLENYVERSYLISSCVYSLNFTAFKTS